MFRNAQVGNGLIRGTAPLPGEALGNHFMEGIASMFPKSSLGCATRSDVGELLVENVAPVCWGSAAKSEPRGFEKALVPSIRVAPSGTLQVGIARVSSIGEIVRNTNRHAKPYNSAARLKWLQAAPASEFKEPLDDACAIVWGTFAPHSLLYTPAASAVVEHV